MRYISLVDHLSRKQNHFILQVVCSCRERERGPQFPSDDFYIMKTLAVESGKYDLLSRLQVYVDHLLKGNPQGISISIKLIRVHVKNYRSVS